MAENKAEGADARASKRKSSIGGVTMKLPEHVKSLWVKNGIRVRNINVLVDRAPLLVVIRATRGMDEKLVSFTTLRDLSYLPDAIMRGLGAEQFKADRPWTRDDQAQRNREAL